ncbi:MAG: hypothetical protein U0670_22125 [Anaerolineae bacterium]
MTAGVLFVQPSKGSPTLAALHRTRAKHRFTLTMTSPADLAKTKRYTVDVKPGKDAANIGSLLDALHQAPGHFTVKVKRKTATFNTTVNADAGLIRFESKGMAVTYTPAEPAAGKADANGAMMLLGVIGMLAHGDAGAKFSVKIENGAGGGFADVSLSPVEAAPVPEAKPAAAAKAPAKKSAPKAAAKTEKAPAKKAAPKKTAKKS